METYTIDLRLFYNWTTLLTVLIITVVIGWTNQTDIYQKLNALPENRTELLPFKEYSLAQRDKTNTFDWKFRFECALDVTRKNILRSMKVGVANRYFRYAIPLKIKDNGRNQYSGDIFTHFHGKTNMSLMYMYEPLTIKEYKLPMTNFFVTNTLIAIEERTHETIHLSRACFANGSIHIFSQDPIYNTKTIYSFDDYELNFNSITDHNYKDFLQRHPNTTEVSRASLFTSKLYKKYDQYLEKIISPMHSLNEMYRTDYINYFYNKGNQTYTNLSLAEKMINVKYEDHICFDELYLYRPTINTTIEEYTTNINVTGTPHKLVILNSTGASNYSKLFIEALNATTVYYITNTTTFDEKVAALNNAEFVLVPSSWDEQYILHFVKGTLMYVAPTPNLQFKVQREGTKYIQFERSGKYEITRESIDTALNKSQECDVVFAYLKNIIKCI